MSPRDQAAELHEAAGCNVGAKLREQREWLGWTQADLEAESVVCVKEIQRAESGRHVIGLVNFVRICKALAISLDEMMEAA